MHRGLGPSFPSMTVLELKRRVSRLNSRELRELHAHIVKVRHNAPEWKKATARKIRAVQAGRFGRLKSSKHESRVG
jgi:hypothetical protein